jgi:hypothetical protein
MPTPTKEELDSNDRDGYVSRCIAVRESEGNHDKDQNVAICMDMWQRAKDSK